MFAISVRSGEPVHTLARNHVLWAWPQQSAWDMTIDCLLSISSLITMGLSYALRSLVFKCAERAKAQVKVSFQGRAWRGGPRTFVGLALPYLRFDSQTHDNLKFRCHRPGSRSSRKPYREHDVFQSIVYTFIDGAYTDHEYANLETT